MLIYLSLILGLLNRYLHKGKFMEAFKLREMWNLLTLFDIKSFIKVICAVIPSQLFAISVVIGFSDGFDLIEL